MKSSRAMDGATRAALLNKGDERLAELDDL